MRFAFAGIDFLGDVFETLLARGWEPVKLFSRPCDGIYDFNHLYTGSGEAGEAADRSAPAPAAAPSDSNPVGLVDSGVIRTTLGEHFGRIDAANLRRAHALLESGKAKGKIVLEGF